MNTTKYPENATVVVSRDQVSCDLAAEVAILNLKNSTYYGLDPVGARIWNLIQTPTTIAAITATILREYDVAAEHCEHDVQDLIQKLAGEQLIKVTDGVSA